MEPLPHQATLFQRLRKGYHLTPADGELYRALEEHQAAYEALFNGLGLTLRKHPKGIFYLIASETATPTTRAREMGLFMLVLIEHVGEARASIVPGLFEEPFRVEQLPHLKRARYEAYMRTIDVHDTDDLRSIIRTLQTFGFVEADGDRFRVRRAAFRFLDVCQKAMDDRAMDDRAMDDEGDGEDEPTPPSADPV